MAEDGRSLSSSSTFGMSLPQWMKNRISTNDRSSLEHNAFSPPQTDDNFLYMSRFKRQQQQQEQLQKQDSTSSIASTDLEAARNSVVQELTQSSKDPFKLKSKGIDDGYKDETSSCGLSVLKVAHQMVNSTKLNTSKTFSTPLQDVLESQFDDQPATEPLNFNRSLRRGSKSLPSSPLSSPKSQRKIRANGQNKYFGSSTMESGWILGGLLKKGKLSQSVSVINEEEGQPNDLKSQVGGLKMKSASQMSIDADFEEKLIERRKMMREMNFYSPTST